MHCYSSIKGNSNILEYHYFIPTKRSTTIEPNLEEMSDYKKPLGKSKTKTIIIAFAIVLVIYAVYALVMGGL